MMPESLLIERRDHVTIFTLNRPAKLNSYDRELVSAIREAMAEFEADPEQYVGILTGAGDRAFCSGSDLTSPGGGGRGSASGPMPGAMQFLEMMGVGSVSKPMIAAVNGLAVGGGTELALNCDIRIASEDAWFGLFEPKRGIVAGVASQLLPRLVTYGDAAWMLLTTERVLAAEAHRIGLVQKVVPGDELLDECVRVAQGMCALSQNALQATKRVMSMHKMHGVPESFAMYIQMLQRIEVAGDNVEGIKAFGEKRDPEFKNRWN